MGFRLARFKVETEKERQRERERERESESQREGGGEGEERRERVSSALLREALYQLEQPPRCRPGNSVPSGIPTDVTCRWLPFRVRRWRVDCSCQGLRASLNLSVALVALRGLVQFGLGL